MKKPRKRTVQLTEGLIVEFTNANGDILASLESRLEEDIISLDIYDSDGSSSTTLIFSQYSGTRRERVNVAND